jgi:cell division protein FtsZ
MRHAAPQGLDPYGCFSAMRKSIEQKILDAPAILHRDAN